MRRRKVHTEHIHSDSNPSSHVVGALISPQPSIMSLPALSRVTELEAKTQSKTGCGDIISAEHEVDDLVSSST